jgi:hypothetical protein
VLTENPIQVPLSLPRISLTLTGIEPGIQRSELEIREKSVDNIKMNLSEICSGNRNLSEMDYDRVPNWILSNDFPRSANAHRSLYRCTNHLHTLSSCTIENKEPMRSHFLTDTFALKQNCGALRHLHVNPP